MSYFGMIDRFLDGDDEAEEKKKIEKRITDSVSMPANDNDIEGIKQYLGWHLYRAGMSSTVFHYLDVLVQKARKDT